MKKILLVIIFIIITLNCFSITIYLKDNNQLTGEIKKIDKQKIYISPRNTKKLFIVNKPDIQMIMDGEIDLTTDILTQKPHGRINYNSYLDVVNIEIDETKINENTEIIDYTANITANDESIKNTKKTTFDGKREGFIIGFGIGGHLTSFKQTLHLDGDTYKSDPEIQMGIATNFKIGFSPKNNIEIYYVSKVSWFSIKNIFEDSVIISDGVGAAGVSYFFSEKLNSTEWVPSPYISMGVGYSGWSTPFEEGSSSSIGTGFFTAFGYEFNKHRRLELSFFINNPSDKEGEDELITNSTVFMLTYNYLRF